MAKFLMMTGPYAGHVAPCGSIAQRLVDRGHEVVWITGRQFKTLVESTGARFHPLPQEIDPDGVDAYEFYPHLKKYKGLLQIRCWIKHVFIKACPSEIRVLDEVFKDFPADVLIGDTVTYGLYLWSERHGLPSAEVSVLPLCLPSYDTAPYGLGLLPGTGWIARFRNRLLNGLVLRLLLRDVAGRLNRCRARIGLELLEDPFFYILFQLPSLVMVPSTPSFEYPRRDQPGHVRFIGPVLLKPNPEFSPPRWWSDLSGPEPVVLVNQGTIATIPEDLIVPAIQGLKDQGMQIVAVPVKEGQLGELPANVHAEAFIPFDHLLPHVDVMVTNGGYGSTQFALAHGIPLVVAGETEDKREVAARVEWSGAGINLRRHRPSPKAIREAVQEVLGNPVYRENARRIQADFARYDAPSQSADLLEALASIPTRYLPPIPVTLQQS